jgi:hypothetical protein
MTNQYAANTIKKRRQKVKYESKNERTWLVREEERVYENRNKGVLSRKRKTRIGNTKFYSDGTSEKTIGDHTFRSDGKSSTRIGDHTFRSDGKSGIDIGNTHFYQGGSVTTMDGHKFRDR